MAILNRRSSKIRPTQSVFFTRVILSATVFSTLIASLATAAIHANEISTTRESTPPSASASNVASSDLPLVFNAASTGGFEGQGRPASRSSGGSRGNCQTRLIALVPGEGTLSDDCSQPTYSSTALTTASMPMLWFYIPEQDSTLQAELALLNDNRQAIALTDVSLPPASGVVGIPLGYELEVDQSYRWIFSISPSTNPARILTVEGIVRRVVPDTELSQQLEDSSERDRLVHLAAAGIWHDVLTELVMLRQQQPENMTIIEDWQHFLSSVGLDVLADAPMVESGIMAQ